MDAAKENILRLAKSVNVILENSTQKARNTPNKLNNINMQACKICAEGPALSGAQARPAVTFGTPTFPYEQLMQKWNGYSPYNPAVAGRVLNIFMVFYNNIDIGVAN